MVEDEDCQYMEAKRQADKAESALAAKDERIKELEEEKRAAAEACELCRDGDEASHVRYVLGGRSK